MTSTLDSGASVGVGGAASDSDGDLRCLCRYEAEFDLGGAGLLVIGDRGASELYEEARLTTGLADLDDTGDCADGGVYGMTLVNIERWVWW